MKHIIFDIGNVLLAFQPQAFLQKHFAPSVVDDLMAMVFGSAEWEALDMGTMMTNDAILALANKHPRCRDEIAFVLENWTHMLTPLEQNVAIAQELKRSGYALYLLSNFHKEAWETVLARYEFFPPVRWPRHFLLRALHKARPENLPAAFAALSATCGRFPFHRRHARQYPSR